MLMLVISSLLFHLLFFFNPHPRTCLLVLESREGREREKETSMGDRDINQLPPVHTPTGGWTHPLGMCPARGSNSWPLGIQDRCSSQLNHTDQGHFVDFFFIHLILRYRMQFLFILWSYIQSTSYKLSLFLKIYLYILLGFPCEQFYSLGKNRLFLPFQALRGVFSLCRTILTRIPCKCWIDEVMVSILLIFLIFKETFPVFTIR